MLQKIHDEANLQEEMLREEILHEEIPKASLRFPTAYESPTMWPIQRVSKAHLPKL
jgi:hypothetical protein